MITRERIGEIALLVLTRQYSKELPTREQIKRELPNIAKEIGVDTAELTEFAKHLITLAVEFRCGCEAELTWPTTDWK